MITLPLIAVAATFLFFAAIPVVVFGLMLETVRERAATVAAETQSEPVGPLPFPVRAAA